MSGLGERLKNSADFFSIGLLARTLFAPFRQISAGAAMGNSLDARLKAFGDRLFSRIIGAVIRTFIIILGILALTAQAILGLALAIIWPAIPVAPVACVLLAVIGVSF